VFSGEEGLFEVEMHLQLRLFGVIPNLDSTLNIQAHLRAGSLRDVIGRGSGPWILIGVSSNGRLI
jgi:hypothetical protein